MDVPFVERLIENGCEYCGDTELQMSVDRVDNRLGHTKSNVKPACIRCNYVRGSMPFEAWTLFIPVMERARELGLFGTWRSLPMSLGDYAAVSDPNSINDNDAM